MKLSKQTYVKSGYWVEVRDWEVPEKTLGVLAISCFIYVLVAWMCTLYENSLKYVHMICVLFSMFIIFQKKV